MAIRPLTVNDHKVSISANPNGGFRFEVVERRPAKRTASSPTVADFQLRDIIKFHHEPLYKSESFLTQKYVVEGLSIAQIAAEIVSSKCAVRNGLKRFGIPIREAHANHGRPPNPRYGVKIRDGKAIPHLAEQRTIKCVVDLKKQGLSFCQIARFLAQIGVPTKCRGKTWHHEMVKKIFTRASE